MTYEAFLKSLIDPHLLQVAVGIFLAVIAELVPAYATKTDVTKRYIALAVAAGLPFLAVLLGILTLHWSAEFPGLWWQAALAAAFFYGGATVPQGTRVAYSMQAAGFRVRARMQGM